MVSHNLVARWEHRLLGLVVAFVLVLVVVPQGMTGAGAATTDSLLAFGPASHVLVEEGDLVYSSCEGSGHVTVQWAWASSRLLVSPQHTGCVPPTFTAMARCQGFDEEGSFRCDRYLGGGATLNVSLSTSGLFSFVWNDPGFHEEIHGNLTWLSRT